MKASKSDLFTQAVDAGLKNGGAHLLQHTFYSHPATRGVPAQTIQELAGHKAVATIQRCMHSSPTVIKDGIRTFEMPVPAAVFREIPEIPEADGAGKTILLQKQESNGGGGGNRTLFTLKP